MLDFTRQLSGANRQCWQHPEVGASELGDLWLPLWGTQSWAPSDSSLYPPAGLLRGRGSHGEGKGTEGGIRTLGSRTDTGEQKAPPACAQNEFSVKKGRGVKDAGRHWRAAEGGGGVADGMARAGEQPALTLLTFRERLTRQRGLCVCLLSRLMSNLSSTTNKKQR